MLALAAGSFWWGAFLGGPLFGSRRGAPTVSRGLSQPIPAAISLRESKLLTVAAAPLVRVAGEFEKQAGVVLGANELIMYYPDLFVDLVSSLHESVPLYGLVTSTEQALKGRQLLRYRGVPVDSIRFVVLPLDSMWVRDYGPTFVKRSDGSVVVVHGNYSKTTGLATRRSDDRAASVLATAVGVPCEPIKMAFTGGNFLTNGEGLAVTTTALPYENAKAGLSRLDIAKTLGDRFGITQWACLGVLRGEPTGHADMFVTFLAPNKVVVGQYDPAYDAENARRLDEAAEALAKIRTSLGPMEVHRIPMPPRLGNRWRTYTNVMMANGVLLMPTFEDVDPELENQALSLYAQLLPGWRVVGIHSDVLAHANGYLHCVSVNIPQFVDLSKFARRDDGTGMPPSSAPTGTGAGETGAVNQLEWFLGD